MTGSPTTAAGGHDGEAAVAGAPTPRPGDAAEAGRAEGDAGGAETHGNVALIVMDPDGTVIQFSAEAERMFGYVEQEVVGAQLAELIIPEHLRAAHESGLARYRETGTGPVLNNTFEMPALCKDRTEIRVRLTVSPLRLHGCDVLVGALRAAPAEPVVPAELSLSADFYRAVVEGAPVLVVVARDEADFWASPAVERLLGKETSLRTTESLERLVHPADRAVAAAAIAGGAIADPVEIRVRGDDGEWHAISFVAADLRDHPALAGTVYYGTDVTRARAAELREGVEAARLLTLINTLGAGVLVQDGDRRILLANPALVEMFELGIAPAALTGTRLTDEAPAGASEDGWVALAEAVQEATHDGAAGPEADREPTPGAEPAPGAAEVVLDGGRVVERTRTPISVDGTDLGHLWVLRDVTAAVEARRALEEHNERLAALSALKNDFISIVSHELRTPLTSISAFTEMLAGPGELTSPDAPAAVAAVARNTDRMLVLVQDLILLSQLETGRQSVATGAVDIADLAHEVGDTVGDSGKVITVRREIQAGPLLDGDEQLLRQLVHTVVGTVAACGAGDVVTLRAEPDDSHWTVVAAAPTDEFITSEQLLAAPLAVLDDASRQRSAALSVLLARAIAHSHGGTLVIDVQQAGMATITVRLPLSGPRRMA
jgi:PAS domain S-box-containing protein